MVRLIVDFQAVDDDGRLTVSSQDAWEQVFSVPRERERVVLDDTEGHVAEAIVERIQGQLWDVVVDWATLTRTPEGTDWTVAQPRPAWPRPAVRVHDVRAAR